MLKKTSFMKNLEMNYAQKTSFGWFCMTKLVIFYHWHNWTSVLPVPYVIFVTCINVVVPTFVHFMLLFISTLHLINLETLKCNSILFKWNALLRKHWFVLFVSNVQNILVFYRVGECWTIAYLLNPKCDYKLIRIRTIWLISFLHISFPERVVHGTLSV